jgi:hypothetical protein
MAKHVPRGGRAAASEGRGCAHPRPASTRNDSPDSSAGEGRTVDYSVSLPRRLSLSRSRR